MTLKNVKPSLRGIARSLEGIHESREYLITNTRQVIILCSQAIISIHQNDLAGAKKKANKAKSLLYVHKKRVTQNLNKYIIIAEQELVEVLSFLAIVEKKQIPSLNTLKVSNESYVLGLLDCIGELKRLVYDNIRNRKSKEAERIFKIMEELYLNLYPFAIYDKLIHEVRRKLDVNRILVEDARTAITEEIRRMELINKLSKA